MSTTEENLRLNRYRPAHAKIDKFYQNSKNNIEDPIFTGFTFDIDKLNSPLFFSLCEKEFAESLRSIGGTDTSLADEIEKKLADAYKFHIFAIPESYEINTIQTKDEIGSDHLAGYGLQEKHYIDKPIYGAVDYIYMVDKVSESQYTDDIGVSELGNGINSNIYRDDAAKLSEITANFNAGAEKLGDDLLNKVGADQKTLENQEESGSDSGGSEPDSGSDTKKKKKLSNEEILTESKKNYEAVRDGAEAEHNENKAAYESQKAQYEELAKDVIENQKLIESYTAADQQCLVEIRKALSEAQSAASQFLDNQSANKDGLLKAYANFCNAIGASGAKVSSLIQGGGALANMPDQPVKKTYKYPTENKEGVKPVEVPFEIIFKVPKMEDLVKTANSKLGAKENKSEEGESSPSKSDGELEARYPGYLEACLLQEISIISTNSDSTKKKINELQAEIEKHNTKLYGEGGTRLEPKEGSPYGNLKAAEDKMNNDTYSQAQAAMDERDYLLSNLEDIEAYQRSGAGDNVKNVSSNLDTVQPIDYTRREGESEEDYKVRINAAEAAESATVNSREKFEVPQTVYDMMGFINGMKDMTTKYPYVMQSVTGLDEAYKSYYELKDPYMGSGDNVITVECLEFLDLRVSSMFNKYFNAVYDRQYRRERVPINLRRFNCSIFIHDIRNFKDALNGGEYDSNDLKPIVELALNYVSVIEFKFYDCEFVAKDTGGIFNTVSNTPAEAIKTQFTFTYGNCVINFLPFDDLKRYLFNKKERDLKGISPKKDPDTNYAISDFSEDEEKVIAKNAIKDLNDNLTDDTNKSITFGDLTAEIDDGNYRKWFDRSELGNINNNDYREYIRRDSSVSVDDYYKSTMVNDFALNSVVNKNKEITALDDALRRIVVGISASTGIPTKGVTDILNIKFIDPILNNKDLDAPVVRRIGNVNNSEILDVTTTKFIGKMEENNSPEKLEFIDFLGNVYDDYSNKKV